MNVQHSSRTDLWYTPMTIINRVLDVFDREITFDSASDATANARIGALSYYSEEIDALNVSWESCNLRSVFLNPPGGKVGNKSKSALFWRRLIDQMTLHRGGHAVFLAFSLEQLQTTQDGIGPSIGDYTFCVPSKRLAFVTPDGTVGSAPSHSNMIVYVPGLIDATQKFQRAFESLGAIVNRKG